jgi:hypothetical protein
MKKWDDLNERERREFLYRQDSGVLVYLCQLIANGNRYAARDFYEGRLKTQ